MEKILKIFLAVLFIAVNISSAAEKQQKPIASINLYNPTQSQSLMPVEVPTGLLGSPGVIEWKNVKLVCDGKEIPFAIKEGRPHWKSAMTADIKNPRSEDLLVFSVTVPTGKWVSSDIIEGSFEKKAALKEDKEKLTVNYQNLSVTIDKQSGMLRDVNSFGQRVLKTPLNINFFTVADEVMEYSEGFDPWPLLYHFPYVTILKQQLLNVPQVKLIDSFSNEAQTIINFELSSGDLKMALTYHVYSSGVVEILADERPWQGDSPWLKQASEIEFELTGEKETIPHLETNFPYFQFKDYAAVVPQAAVIHKNQKINVLELGQQIVNGRQWIRKLYFVQPSENIHDYAELADEGLIIDVQPLCQQINNQKVVIVRDDGDHVPAQTIADAFKKMSLECRLTNEKKSVAKDEFVIELLNNSNDQSIRGDGYKIITVKNGINILALTRSGLNQAALRAAEKISMQNQKVYFPLIAMNPAADLRIICTQSGPTEGDYIYGPESDWYRILGEFIDNGVNVIENTGAVSNWKMPITYKYIPELMSDSPDDQDPLTGWKVGYPSPEEKKKKFSDIEETKAHALRLMKFIQDKGAKVWRPFGINRAPSTYEKAFPQACPTKKPAVWGSGGIVCWTDPIYQKMLEAHLKESLELYPIDGFIIGRGDIYFPCKCDRCKAYLENSKTKNLWWEQINKVYATIRQGCANCVITTCPYHDVLSYKPKLDSMLPKDLYVIEDGSSSGLLAKDFDMLAPFGETWIDSPFSNFRAGTTSRMKRYIAGRNAYYMGGAYSGLELSFASVGFFTWQPSGTPNTLRYKVGKRMFGDYALDYVYLMDSYEQLWEIMAKPLLPPAWANLTADKKQKVSVETRRVLQIFRQRLADLKQKTENENNKVWFAMVDLYGVYTEYNLHKLELIDQMYKLVLENQNAVFNPKGLDENLRTKLIEFHKKVYDEFEIYDKAVLAVPPSPSRVMLVDNLRKNKIIHPWREVVSGYQGDLDNQLKIKQFAGFMNISDVNVTAGSEFTIDIELVNTGILPWIEGVGQRLVFETNQPSQKLWNQYEQKYQDVSSNDFLQTLGLPKIWKYEGMPIVYGDRKTVSLKCKAPAGQGQTEIKIKFYSVYPDGWPPDYNVICQKLVKISWH